MTTNEPTQVAEAAAALERAHRARRPLAEQRALWQQLDRALDAAVTAARSAGSEQLHRARTQRELHRLAALSTPGLLPATVVRTASRGGTGPHIAGMVLDPMPPVGHGVDGTYGLDLPAVLDRPLPAPPVVQLPVPRAAEERAPVSVA